MPNSKYREVRQGGWACQTVRIDKSGKRMGMSNSKNRQVRLEGQTSEARRVGMPNSKDRQIRLEGQTSQARRVGMSNSNGQTSQARRTAIVRMESELTKSGEGFAIVGQGLG